MRHKRMGLVVLTAGCGLATGPPALAVTQTTSTSQSLSIAAAPNAQATRPESITATGTVGIPSTIAIYAQPAAVPCAAQAAAEAGHATLVDQRTVPAGPIAFTVMFTPSAAGTYYICTYLDGSSGGTTEHQSQVSVLAVAPAPSSPPATTPSPVPASPRAPACVVPSLGRHTLRGAEHLLTVAHCKIGKVYYATAGSLRVARHRFPGRTLAQVVVSQTPVAGSVKVGGYTVAVRLAYGLDPTARARPVGGIRTH
ncbi:MAG: hypothetical protein ACR2KV_17440 [Solirubrobacteraceae bacterium]